MQTLEILIEENAFGAVRPVEVVADAPVAALIPLLVEELHLPHTDLFGKQLFYQLRQTPDGNIIPEGRSLRASGVRQGAKLSLAPYTAEGPELNMTTFGMRQEGFDPTLHSAVTLADSRAFLGTNPHVPPRKRSRRAFLALSGAALGVGLAGTSYAAYRTWGEGFFQSLLGGAKHGGMTTQRVAPVKPARPAAPLLPTSASMVFTFQRHMQGVRTVAWSNTGNLLASGADDQKILLWQPDGTLQLTLPQNASVRALAWAADGQRLVAGVGNQVVFYNGQTGQRLARDRRHTQMVTAVAWSTQGQQLIVSAAQDAKAFVWDSTQYQARQTFARHTSAIQAASWASDGETVATATQGGIIRVWSGLTAQERHGYYLDGEMPVRALAFSPAGSQLAAGGNDGVIRLWANGLQAQQQAMGKFGLQCVDQPQRLHLTQSPIRALVWSADGKLLLSGAEDGTIALWYPAQQQAPLLTVKQNGLLRSLAWSPDGKMFASTMGNTVILWKLA